MGGKNKCYAMKTTHRSPVYSIVYRPNLFNKAIISHSEAEGNQRNRHVVKMFRLLTKIFYGC